MTKKCPKCEVVKTAAEFGIHSSKKDGLQSHCKVCRSESSKKWWSENRELSRQRVRRNKENVKERFYTFIFDYLSTHPCIDCGERDPIVLEFDHVTGIKEYNVSCMVGCTNDKIQSEIDKCVVRCANCHKRKTSKQFGYWKESRCAVEKLGISPES